MAQLAIKGHETRGKEVIEILEMLGGENVYKLSGTNEECAYYEKNGVIHNTAPVGFNNFKLFTLEEFLEKYPYKVGDKVQHKGATSCGTVYVIERMEWENNRIDIEYEIRPLYDYNHTGLVTVYAYELQPYKEEVMEDKPNSLQQLKEYFENTPRDIIEKEWHEYDKYNEINPKVNEYLEYVNNIRQPKYPKTYEECCKVLFPHSIELGKVLTSGCNCELLKKFGELLICRDAYWKLAGEQMGLGKPWKPNFVKEDKKFMIACYYDKIYTAYATNYNRVLVFPTEEMRDAFYENFTDLIEECKELI